MAKFINPEEIISKASRGYIADYYATGLEGGLPKVDRGLLRPKQNLHDLKELMKDSTFNTEVNVIVDAIMKKGYKIVKRSDKTKRVEEKENKFNRDYRGYQLLRSIFLNLLVYRNTFAEIEFKGKTVENLHLLETPEMNINITPHGEIIGYTQIHESGPMVPSVLDSYTKKRPPAQMVFFEPEECLHIAPSKLSTNPWGYVDTRSVKRIVNSKIYLENYIDNLFLNNRFRDLFIIKNATSKDQVKSFVESLKHGVRYPDKDIVVEGDIEQKQLRDMKDIEMVLKLHEEYKIMIREFLRVPPLMTGDTGSNKSTGEFEVRYAFDNTVVSWQKIVEDEFNNELFPRMGWGEYIIQFFPVDKLDESKAIEMAVQLKGLGYDDNTINKFLINKGVELPTDAKIEKPEILPQEGNQQGTNSTLKQSLQNKNAPSRKARDKTVDKVNIMEKRETRQDQIIGKSSNVKFNQYPYIF